MKVSSVPAPNMKMKKNKRTTESLLRMQKHKLLYLMVLPGLVYFIIFKYFPMGDW